MIRDIKRHPDERIGKPETLRFELSGKLSRRINKEHRRVYQIIDGMLVVFQCRYHYQQE